MKLEHEFIDGYKVVIEQIHSLVDITCSHDMSEVVIVLNRTELKQLTRSLTYVLESM